MYIAPLADKAIYKTVKINVCKKLQIRRTVRVGFNVCKLHNTLSKTVTNPRANGGRATQKVTNQVFQSTPARGADSRCGQSAASECSSDLRARNFPRKFTGSHFWRVYEMQHVRGVNNGADAISESLARLLLHWQGCHEASQLQVCTLKVCRVFSYSLVDLHRHV